MNGHVTCSGGVTKLLQQHLLFSFASFRVRPPDKAPVRPGYLHQPCPGAFKCMQQLQVARLLLHFRRQVQRRLLYTFIAAPYTHSVSILWKMESNKQFEHPFGHAIGLETMLHRHSRQRWLPTRSHERPVEDVMIVDQSRLDSNTAPNPRSTHKCS